MQTEIQSLQQANRSWQLVKLARNNQLDDQLVNNQLLTWASRHGYLTLARELLQRYSPDLSANNYAPVVTAIQANHLGLVKLYLESDQTTISADTDNNLFLRTAVTAGNVAIVNYLLSHLAVNLGNLDSALVEACSHPGNLDVVQALLTSQRVDPTTQDGAALINAAQAGDVEILSLLLRDTRLSSKPHLPGSYCFRALVAACQVGNPEVVEMLLDSSGIDIQRADNHLLKEALRYDNPKVIRQLVEYSQSPVDAALPLLCQAGYVSIIRELLLRVDPVMAGSDMHMPRVSKGDNLPLRVAAANGQLQVVKALLEDGRSDPTAHDSEALVVASKYNHPQIVQLLLEDGRADPAAHDSEALVVAAQNGCPTLVKLQLPYSDSAVVERAAKLATRNGHVAVVNLLLGDSRATSNIQHDQLLEIAVSNNHPAIVNLLLVNGRVNPASNSNQLLITAISHGYAEVVKLLLLDSRIDTSQPDNQPLSVATKHNHPEVVKQLVQDERVSDGPNLCQILRLAATSGYAGVVGILLQSKLDFAIPRVFPDVIQSAQVEVVKLLLQHVEHSPDYPPNSFITKQQVKQAVASNQLRLAKLLLNYLEC